ncbi:hypothetical protein CRG98_012345 [Punica granatum]|uniref:Uncharacterized protein n=1 Tax=Punica granatum TaxID=22663 RepID=A0A2I0KGI1_PUNGR|nr:hypothetical protein CRG98_012345 [Punica granatum]
MRALSHGLGVSTFPWGRVTETLEKKSPLAILQPKDRGPASYPCLRGTGYTYLLRHWSFETKNSKSGGSITCGPISRTSFRYSICLGFAVLFHLLRELGCILLTRFDTVTSMKHSDRLLTDRNPYND